MRKLLLSVVVGVSLAHPPPSLATDLYTLDLNNVTLRGASYAVQLFYDLSDTLVEAQAISSIKGSLLRMRCADSTWCGTPGNFLGGACVQRMVNLPDPTGAGRRVVRVDCESGTGLCQKATGYLVQDLFWGGLPVVTFTNCF